MSRSHVVQMPRAEARHLAGDGPAWPATPEARCLAAGPGRAGPPPPGRVEYAGDGAVRLDEAAVAYLAQLPPGEDFRVRFTGAGPVLAVGADTYLLGEEEAARP